MLETAFVQGRLTKDEFDARVGATLASRTYADLATQTADIPAVLHGEPRAQPVRKPAGPQRARVVRSRACVIIAAGRRAGGFCLAVGGVGRPQTCSVAGQQKTLDRLAGVWGSAACTWSGEER